MKPSKAQRGRLEGVGEAANETQGGKILFANRASLKHKPAAGNQDNTICNYAKRGATSFELGLAHTTAHQAWSFAYT